MERKAFLRVLAGSVAGLAFADRSVTSWPATQTVFTVASATYYGSAHLERDVGRALLYLATNGGACTEAQHRLSAAVAHFPKQASRGKTLALANLAHVTMARDDPERAVALGNEALMADSSAVTDT